MARNTDFCTASSDVKMVLYGYPYEQIIQLANKLTVDLIIMGAYGKENKDKYYIGSTIQKVLRMASCPD